MGILKDKIIDMLDSVCEEQLEIEMKSEYWDQVDNLNPYNPQHWQRIDYLISIHDKCHRFNLLGLYSPSLAAIEMEFSFERYPVRLRRGNSFVKVLFLWFVDI